MVKFQALCWKSVDVYVPSRRQRRAAVSIFGRTEDGLHSVCVHVVSNPFFYVLRVHEGVVIDVLDKKGVSFESRECEMKDVGRGFCNNETSQFLRLSFHSLKAFHDARRTLGAIGSIDLYESDVDPVMRFLHLGGFQPAGWLVLNTDLAESLVEESALTSVNLEYRLDDVRGIVPDHQAKNIAPFVVSSFDIEAVSGNGKSFPQASRSGDKVIQIATAIKRIGTEEPPRRVVLCLDETASGPEHGLDGIEVRWFAEEQELLDAWAMLVRVEADTDIFVGWNIMGFDFAYLYERAMYVGAEVFLGKLNRTLRKKVKIDDKDLTTNAYGAQNFKYVETEGILQLDLYPWTRRTYARDFESFKLNEVAKHFLGDQKLDISAQDIFQLFRQGPAERAKIARYCMQDAMLPLRLLEKLDPLVSQMEMANATLVPIDYLTFRGQQIKVYSLIVKHANSKGYVCRAHRKGAVRDLAEKYKGATVLTPKRGAHYVPIACLDFASLYPSIMRAYNLCHTTLVREPKYLDLPDVTYKTFGKIGTFANKGEQGLLPSFLSSLADGRKRAQNNMNEAKKNGDLSLASVYNAQQLAIKVTMNSAYGFCGAVKNGIMPCREVAESVTFIGRETLFNTERILKENYNCEVYYGDSVAAHTPLAVRRDGTTCFTTIDRLAGRGDDRWMRCHDGKEYCELQGVHVWSEQGWTPVLRVIRHRLAPEKRMLRVATRTGVVDVTSDHSLLRDCGAVVRPSELAVGDRLLHADTPPFRGDLCDPGHGVLVVTGQLRASVAFAALSDAGSVLRLDVVEGGGDQYKITVQGTAPEGHADEVVSVLELARNDEYVYDVTTINGHFACGVGRIVAHNTDSVFVRFHEAATVADAIRLGKEAAQRVTREFQFPMRLEWEKVFRPLLLAKAKFYGGLLFTSEDKAPYLEVKGMQIVRRDSCHYVRDTMKEAFRLIMDNEVKSAEAYVRQRAIELVCGRVETRDLIVASAYNANYAPNKALPPAAVVAMRMKERDPAGAPLVGDRVPYIFVESSNGQTMATAKAKSELAEDPAYAAKENMLPDYLHYFTNKFAPAISSLFAVVYRCKNDDAQRILFADVSLQKDPERLRRDANACGQTTVTQFFDSKHLSQHTIPLKKRRVQTCKDTKQTQITKFFASS